MWFYLHIAIYGGASDHVDRSEEQCTQDLMVHDIRLLSTLLNKLDHRLSCSRERIMSSGISVHLEVQQPVNVYGCLWLDRAQHSTKWCWCLGLYEFRGEYKEYGSLSLIAQGPRVPLGTAFSCVQLQPAIDFDRL